MSISSSTTNTSALPQDFSELTACIHRWSAELGFADCRITSAQLNHAEEGLQAWLDAGFHGQMDYMAEHGMKRARPSELVPGTVRVISVRMNYLPLSSTPDWREKEEQRLDQPNQAVISVYARGRDYHKVLRQRLQQLADKITQHGSSHAYRVFTDSAPVMEVAFAQQSGLGWRGKHTLLLHREAGSLFFLGEIYTDLPLPVDAPAEAHCGSCEACITVCPTQAIVAPYKLDARRCISYLTIEHKTSIPIELRPLMGNRILGCDDCQLVCPWNKFAQKAVIPDFDVRNAFDQSKLIDLFAWTEEEFNTKCEGSAIRRIGHERWLRNIAIALGNALRHSDTSTNEVSEIVLALQSRLQHPSALVQEHVMWALAQQGLSNDLTT